jgi:acetyl esterase
MLRVLGVLSELGPQPVERLSPEDARRQPNAADAVQELLRRNNQPPAPSLGVATRDITIPGPAGPLQARLYTPTARARAGARLR